MKRLKTMWRILKTIGADKIVYSFIIFVIFSAFILRFIEPGINNINDGIWYCFSVISSCGFGDLICVTIIGRIISIILGIFSMLIIALIPGILVSYYLEFVKIKENESISLFLDELEHLPELSKDDLERISKKIKSIKYKQPRN